MRKTGPILVGLGALAVLGLVVYSRGVEYPDDPNGGEPGSEGEDYAKRDLQSTCDPTEKPGVQAFRRYVLARFGGGDAGIVRDCAVGGASEHKEGRAWDWSIAPVVGQARADVDAFFVWLTANRDEVIRRAGIMYIIFNRQMWRAYGPREWLPYTGSDPHTGHVHLSFSREGAAGKTSWYRREESVT